TNTSSVAHRGVGLSSHSQRAPCRAAGHGPGTKTALGQHPRLRGGRLWIRKIYAVCKPAAPRIPLLSGVLSGSKLFPPPLANANDRRPDLGAWFCRQDRKQAMRNRTRQNASNASPAREGRR